MLQIFIEYFFIHIIQFLITKEPYKYLSIFTNTHSSELYIIILSHL